MNNLTLKQLRYFVALAKHQHFGRAADACAISQPALSMQIKELEEHLGLVLFERDARQIRLTDYGQEFLARAKIVLRSVDDLADFSRSAKESIIGQIKLGIIPTIAPYILPKLMLEFKGSYPDLDIHVRETLTSKLLDELSEGSLDCAILALPVSVPTFEEVALFDEQFYLVRSKKQSGQPMPQRSNMINERLLLLEEGHCFRDQALSFCDVGRKKPKHGLDGSSLSTLVQMVAADMGMTFLPKMAIPIETLHADVCVSAFPEPQPSRTIGMIWRRTSPMSGHYQKLADAVRRVWRAID